MAMELTEFAFPMDAEECEEGFDREYTADDFARYFRAFLTSGIIADGGNIAESLQVVANDDMTTTLKAGNLIIDGYRYELMKDMVFQHRAADGVLDRIDRISITLDTAEREIHAILREGEYSYKPVAPQCRRSSEYMDYVVADVRIVKGAIKITQANITDTRLSAELCGIAFPFWKLDTGPFFAQLNSFYNEFVLKSDRSYDEFLAWTEEKKAEIETWQGEEEAEVDVWQEEKKEGFDEWVQDFVNKWESWLLGQTKGWQEEIIDWFDNLKEHLSENAAVQLQEQIGNLNDLKTDEKENLVLAINSLCMPYDETMAILRSVITVFVTLTTFDGANVEGQTVTLQNVVTGESVVKEYSNDGISFEVLREKEYIITVSDMTDEFYITPEPVNISVEDDISVEDESVEVNLEYKLTSFNDLSWSKIISISENGKAEEFFKLHDTKEITLTTGESVEVEIVGFNCDILASDSSKKAGITFGTKNCVGSKIRMTEHTTVTGILYSWVYSNIREEVLEEFYESLPEEIQSGIKSVLKDEIYVSSNVLQNTYITYISESIDNVWLFSAAELGIEDIKSTSGVSEEKAKTYPVFSDDESRKKINVDGDVSLYWTRTSALDDNYGGYAAGFGYINKNGKFKLNVEGTAQCGMAIGFCI